jgi:hypothetical protein
MATAGCVIGAVLFVLHRDLARAELPAGLPTRSDAWGYILRRLPRRFWAGYWPRFPELRGILRIGWWLLDGARLAHPGVLSRDSCRVAQSVHAVKQ